MSVNDVKKYKGIITALITPINRDLSINSDSLRTLIDLQVESGIIGFFVLGTYGEGVAIHPEKRKRFLEKVAEYSPSNILLINNVSSTSLETSLELVKHSADVGVHNVASLPPFYYKVTAKEVREFYRELARQDCNLFIYNNPGKTGFDVTPRILDEIARENPSLVGIKDSSGRLDRLIELTERFINRLYVAIASDSFILDAFLYGADAHICGLCNAIPEIGTMIYRSIANRDYDRAVKYQKVMNRLRMLTREMGYEGLSVVKALLSIRGVDVGNPMPPNRVLEREDREVLKNVLENICSESGIQLKIKV